MIEKRKSPAVEAGHSQGHEIGHPKCGYTTESASLHLRYVVENHFLGEPSATWEYLYAVGAASYESGPGFFDTLTRLPDNERIGLKFIPAGGGE